jgi:hypothetical protein
MFSWLSTESYYRPVERRGARAPCCDGVMVGVACEVEGARCGSRFIRGVRAVTEIFRM